MHLFTSLSCVFPGWCVRDISAGILSDLFLAVSPEHLVLGQVSTACSVNTCQMDVSLGVQRMATICDCCPQVPEGLQAPSLVAS